jgi:hypothetical protein
MSCFITTGWARATESWAGGRPVPKTAPLKWTRMQPKWEAGTRHLKRSGLGAGHSARLGKLLAQRNHEQVERQRWLNLTCLDGPIGLDQAAVSCLELSHGKTARLG